MIDDPENTTTDEQDETPKVRIVRIEEPDDTPLEEGYCLSQEGKALLHHLQMDENDPEFARKIRDLQHEISIELIGGRNGEFDRSLVEQFALLDKAFRFYLSGGEAQKPDERSFLLALRAQEQSAATLHMSRRMMRLLREEERQQRLDKEKEYERVRREKRKSEEQSSRSASKYFDRFSE